MQPVIDKLIHEPARFQIMAQLYVVKSADFLFVMRQTDLTFGNLSSHISKLDNAKYVNVKKDFIGKKPSTMLKLTPKGRNAFDEYRKEMKNALKMP